MDTPYRDAEWLRRKYHDEGLTQRAIAEECGMSTTTIRRWMKRNDIETREIAGENHGLYGKERSEETKRKIAETLDGREVSTETRRRMADWQKGRSLPREVREKISDALRGVEKSTKTRLKMSRSTAGKNNPNWKGGEYTHEWYGPGWEFVRNRVRERDEVCQQCGHDGSSTRLEVHHIIPIRHFRNADGIPINAANHEANLLLLCKRCHGRAEHGVIEVKPVDEELFSDQVISIFDT